ncbi:hypothetical protein [Pleomorphomonas carboxyditropha]|uniref:hypothetical protein n=1 Tax=Pleomorphomonas carboxyditropha TaxID=2023338 RepID=UPI0010560320|nr:hypothetical protein [Pleomorphomonas carboxyditropha]
MARLEKIGSTASDAQISDEVAAATRNRPAPIELVKDNRELFGRIADDARMDEIRASAPKLFAYLGDPDGAAIPRDDFWVGDSVRETHFMGSWRQRR